MTNICMLHPKNDLFNNVLRTPLIEGRNKCIFYSSLAEIEIGQEKQGATTPTTTGTGFPTVFFSVQGVLMDRTNSQSLTIFVTQDANLSKC